MHVTTNINNKNVYYSLCEFDYQSKYLQLCIRQFLLLSKVDYMFRLNALTWHHEAHTL